MNIAIVTQARTTSTRLPQKVLLEAKGKTVLQHHIERLKAANVPIVVATTSNQTDDILALFAQSNGLPCHRGSENDVLSRYYFAAIELKLDAFVRVTSDCPLIDGKLIAQALNIYKQNYTPQLYLSNTIERTFARGFDFEICSTQLLKEAYQNATLPYDREHVTPFIHQNRLGTTLVKQLTTLPDKNHYRITLDTLDDWKLISTLINQFDADTLDYKQITDVLDQRPDLVAMNAHIEQKKV